MKAETQKYLERIADNIQNLLPEQFTESDVVNAFFKVIDAIPENERYTSDLSLEARAIEQVDPVNADSIKEAIFHKQLNG
jgi:sulfur relay (sulfurtransferase) DsrF/TusC family protein